MSRYLTIIEVSQKQAFIFGPNKLRENINNSNIIAYITSCDYISDVIADSEKFSEANNLVYQGGGHTILQFNDAATAKEVVAKVTKKIICDYPDIEVFSATTEYINDEKDSRLPKTANCTELPARNIKYLTSRLEEKKALRLASFKQGSFGVELIDVNTGKPVMKKPKVNSLPDKYTKERHLDGYVPTYEFENLGGTKNESSFIAVVHIDGNGMGKRVEEYSNTHKTWEEYRKNMRIFSESIDTDFKESYHEMTEILATNIETSGSPIKANLSLKKDKYNNIFLPVRRIITEGDDICFVSEGRIGIEAAVTFINCLTKPGRTNKADNKPYAACAGVALVHTSYPFYKAYELAEALCKNAKNFGATLSNTDNGSSVSAIDWHIEYGELKDSLELTRKDYNTADHCRLELRPYIVKASEETLSKEPVRQYNKFRKLMDVLAKDDFYANSTLKELRGKLKQGETATNHFLRFHGINDLLYDHYFGTFEDVTGESKEAKIFIDTLDDPAKPDEITRRSTIFDGIEAMDTYLKIEEE